MRLIKKFHRIKVFKNRFGNLYIYFVKSDNLQSCKFFVIFLNYIFNSCDVEYNSFILNVILCI